MWLLLGDILFIAFAVYITYTGFFYSMEQIRFDMRSAALKIPYQYIYMSTVVGFGLATNPCRSKPSFIGSSA